MECFNFPADVKEQLYKLASICLCPNLSGQICMVRRQGGQAGGHWVVGCKSMHVRIGVLHVWLGSPVALALA